MAWPIFAVLQPLRMNDQQIVGVKAECGRLRLPGFPLLPVVKPVLAIIIIEGQEPANPHDRGPFDEPELLGQRVAYLLAADIVSGPLPSRLREVNQPVIITRNRFSRPRPCPLACICAH
jgi:hypothetical protein